MTPFSFPPSFLLATALLAGGTAAAQPAGPHHHVPVPQQNVYLALMDTMMVRMQHVPAGGTAEAGFLGQMIPHHEGAVAMADYEIEHGRQSPLVQLAKSIRAEQTHELQLMRAWLGQASPRPAAGDAAFRQSMTRAMDVMMHHLPNPADLAGPTDRDFARVMIPHHQAAIDMARAVLAAGTTPTLRAFALQMIAAQQVEIEQMSTLAGLAAPAPGPYARDRVYTANQVSNTVSVVDPAQGRLLGEIRLGKPYPDVLNPLYRGQALVHGLRYSPGRKLLAVVSIGSNSVTFVSTETNQPVTTLYVGRSPHEPTFTPDGKQVWVSVRGEAYVSVIDVDRMAEVQRVPVADGPGMIAFTPDGKRAYVCSSFTPEVDIVNTATYRIEKKIPVTSPFSPNIFTSPDGKWIALTHKDVGKVTVLNTASQTVAKVIATGAITNHVTFTRVDGKKLLMLATVGGENKVRVFDPARDFAQTDTLNVGALPHGLWA
ncbi:MAG TPA: DUF305 domain-containing protein, partial [Cytophagales bacterium]